MTMVSEFKPKDVALFRKKHSHHQASKRKARVLKQLKAYALELKKRSGVAVTEAEGAADDDGVPAVEVSIDEAPYSGDVFVEAVLTELGLHGFVEDFALAGVDSTALMSLSESRVSELIPVPAYAEIFVSWLRSYKGSADGDGDGDGDGEGEGADDGSSATAGTGSCTTT